MRRGIYSTIAVVGRAGSIPLFNARSIWRQGASITQQIKTLWVVLFSEWNVSYFMSKVPTKWHQNIRHFIHSLEDDFPKMDQYRCMLHRSQLSGGIQAAHRYIIYWWWTKFCCSAHVICRLCRARWWVLNTTSNLRRDHGPNLVRKKSDYARIRFRKTDIDTNEIQIFEEQLVRHAVRCLFFFFTIHGK